MMGWCIALGVLVLLILLLCVPLVLTVDYHDPDKRYMWKLSWFGIPLFSNKRRCLWNFLSKHIHRRKKKRIQKAKKAVSESDDSAGKMHQYWQLLKDYLPLLPKPLRWLWKGIAVRHLIIGVQVGRFDARECALAYGAANALVHTSLGLLQSCMRLQIEQVCVQCAFGKTSAQWIVQGKVYFTPLAGLAALGSLVFAIAVAQYRKQSLKEERQRCTKNAAGQK